MDSLRNSRFVFWTFMFLIILLQLSTSGDIPFIIAFLYAMIIVFTVLGHENIVRNKLIEKFYYNKNTIQLIIYTVLLSFITSIFLACIGYFLFEGNLSKPINNHINTIIISLFFGLFLFTVLISGATYAIELFKQKIKVEIQHQELKNSVLEMEIEHLRTQLSPHFTFNILNNLQFLIRKDKDEALDLLSRYSTILRYYVYKSQNKWIKLNDEITFLLYYFQLEKDRSGEDLQINQKIDVAEANNLLIIPFLLSTFIENAFKHISSHQESANFICFNITLTEENQLILLIENTYNYPGELITKDGVGLQQAKKRLELSYHDDYSLDITKNDEVYSVCLKLQLTK